MCDISNCISDYANHGWQKVLDIGNNFEAVINFLLFLLVSFYVLSIFLKWFGHKFKLHRLTYYIDKTLIKVFEIIPNKTIKSLILKLFNIEPEIMVLLPKPSERNYQYLAYLLNGINHFLDENLHFRKKIKIILVDNSTQISTEQDIKLFVNSLSDVKRYIIIATMSDIFDILLSSDKIEKRLKDGYNLTRIIGVLASQSKRYVDYEDNSNIIRVSPPDFDEARKASVHIVSKLISSYCPSKSCEYHKNNNIIIISSNSYGEAVKESFSTLFAEHKVEFDTSTNVNVDARSLNKKIREYRYSFDNKNGIIEDRKINPYSFEDLAKEKIDGAINIIFIIGYEPNISQILIEIDRAIKDIDFANSEIEILLSTTVSIEDWRKSVTKTLTSLSIRDKIDEVNFIKMRYPEFHFNSYKSKKIYFKLYHFSKESGRLEEFKLEFKKDEIINIVLKDTENYINSFINMSLNFAKEISENWNINLLSLKNSFFYKSGKWKKNRDREKIIGVKILSNGDSIDHFIIERLEYLNS